MSKKKKIKELKAEVAAYKYYSQWVQGAMASALGLPLDVSPGDILKEAARLKKLEKSWGEPPPWKKKELDEKLEIWEPNG